MAWPDTVRQLVSNRDIASSGSESSETKESEELLVLPVALKAKYDAFWGRIQSSVHPRLPSLSLSPRGRDVREEEGLRPVTTPVLESIRQPESRFFRSSVQLSSVYTGLRSFAHKLVSHLFA